MLDIAGSKTCVWKVANGYILSNAGSVEVHHSLEAVFDRMLFIFEGLSPAFVGSFYGKVTIKRHDANDATNRL